MKPIIALLAVAIIGLNTGCGQSKDMKQQVIDCFANGQTAVKQGMDQARCVAKDFKDVCRDLGGTPWTGVVGGEYCDPPKLKVETLGPGGSAGQMYPLTNTRCTYKCADCKADCNPDTREGLWEFHPNEDKHIDSYPVWPPAPHEKLCPHVSVEDAKKWISKECKRYPGPDFKASPDKQQEWADGLTKACGPLSDRQPQ